MPNPDPYRFSGITDFIAKEGLPPSFAAKIPGLFFVQGVATALSQIPTAAPKDRASMYAVADTAIAALKAAVATAEAAYAHVKEACPPPQPEPAPEPAAAPKPAKEKPLAGS